MKIFNQFLFACALLFGATSGMQAQCTASFTWTASNNTISLVSSVTGMQAGVYYSWNFGDSNFGTGATTSHTYNSTGLFLVCLTASDSSCSVTYCDSVWVNGTGNPCSSFATNIGGWTDTSSTSNGLVNFYSSSTGGTAPYTYSWDLGDGNTSTAQYPNHQYANPNQYYLACVTVTDALGCTATDCDSIDPYNPCGDSLMYTSFTYTINPNNLATFSSTVSGGTAASYYWSFGNGNYSMLANPTYQFPGTGTYVVSLWVTYSNSCSRSYSLSIPVTNSNPCNGFSASFSHTNPSGTTVAFNSTITGGTPSYYYSWLFGDGGTSNQANPIHTYASSGVYSAILMVYDTNGCTYTHIDSVVVGGGSNPCAGFSANYSYTANGNVATFASNVTSGTAPYTYSWVFGDGGTSTLANPVHTYPNVTTYYGAYLIVTDANGCAYTAYDTVAITATGSPCNLNEVTMVLNLDNYAYETSWDLRDAGGTIVASGSGYTPNQNGSTITQTFCLPTGCYTYNIYDSYGDGICCLYGQGDYTLTDATGAIMASGGSFGYSESTTFCVGGATNPCTGFNASFSSTTSGNVVNFVGTASWGSAVQYIWNFGDNSTGTGANPVHTYSNATSTGYYVVCVTAIDSQGCTATFCDSIAVNPAPCAQNMVTLTLNLDNFAYETSWDVTDATGAILYSGSGYNSTQNGTTVYQNFCLPTGCYDFNIYDSFGDGICCLWGNGSFALTDAAGNVLANGGAFGHSAHTNFCVGGATNPCGNFSAAFSTSAGANGAISFTSTTTAGTAPFTYNWNFGGSNTSTLANPTFIYTANGYHTACVTVTDNNGCTSTYCNSFTVTSNGNPGGPCAGMYLDMNIVQDTTNAFVLYLQPVVHNAPSNGVFSFVWDFGDNSGAISGTPSHQYNNFGSYVICLMAFDSVNGCAATFCDTITIDSAGNFSRTPDYKDVKPGFMVNILPPEINFGTAVAAISGNDNIAINLFPNPTSDVINLAINSVENINGDVTILDITGKSVYTETLTFAAGEQQVALPVQNFPAGVYLVKLTSDNVQKTMKFIKE